MNYKLILSHPTANQNVRQLAKGLRAHGLLDRFFTGVACFSDDLYYPLLIGPFRIIRRRSFDISLKKNIKTFPTYEISRLVASFLGLRFLLRHEMGLLSVDHMYKKFDAHVSKKIGGASAVYAYEDGALETFTVAKRLGIKCIYELPIAYWQTVQRLLGAEAQRMSNWAPTLGGGINDSQEKLERKTRELEMADVVIVPSQFVLKSLPAWANEKKVVFAPFGSPVMDDLLDNTIANKQIGNRRLRVLFVGAMGQRKGLGDLFAAFHLLDPMKVELVVLGSLLAPMDFYKGIFSNFTYEPTRDHNSVLALMRTCDVFCLPSIVEGRALVMQEAMSQGLPIIITPNTGGSDLVREGETGFLVPIRSPEIIAEKITWFIDHKQEIPRMSMQSKLHAASYTWENYCTEIITSLT